MEPRTRSTNTAWLTCAASAVLFGAATPAAKLILDHVPPVTLAGLLYLGAAVCRSRLSPARNGPARRAVTW